MAAPKKKIIIDYTKASQEVLTLLKEAFPFGYEDSDVIKFTNLKGEKVSAIAVDSEDATYLVKVHIEMAKKPKPPKKKVVPKVEIIEEEEDLEIADVEDSDTEEVDIEEAADVADEELDD